MATINYTDKVAINVNPSIPDINKVNASDMNLIKQVGNQVLTTLGVYTDTWSSSATYEAGQIAIYDNRVFKNLTGTNTATTPDEDTTNWEETNITEMSAGAEIPIRPTPPSNPQTDDLWIDTSDESGGTNILSVIFPVGSIVIKADNEDYSNWLGFTWERTLVGRVAVGIDSTQTEFDTIGETGGEKTHTLTVAEMPSHSHTIKTTQYGWISVMSAIDNNYGFTQNGAYKDRATAYDGNEANNKVYADNNGGGQAHNILQPYQVVAYWKRTA